MGWLTDPQAWIAFATLAALEIVLGIDNIVFISILVGKLPEGRRALGYRLGLALAFLLMIGVMLVVEGTGNHVPKGYIYFAMAFSLFVEMLNMRAGSRGAKPVQLR